MRCPCMRNTLVLILVNYSTKSLLLFADFMYYMVINLISKATSLLIIESKYVSLCFAETETSVAKLNK
jgi:hypothetical protein